MSSRIRWSIFGIALIGLALSVAALRVHYHLLTDPSYVSPCDLSATFNCSAAYLSNYGTVGVFGFIASAMVACCIVIATMGPPTARLRLEQISR